MRYRYRTDEEMKDSGVEWICKIPKDWKVSKLKYICSIVNGQVDPTKKPYSDMPHIGPENIEKFSGRILDYKLAHQENLTSGKYYFEPNNILYGKINPQLGKVCKVDFYGICSADMYPLKANNKDVISNYLIYYMLSNVFFNQSISFPARAGIPKINREELLSVFVNLPKIDEQEKIANFLDKNISQFDLIISKKEELIKKLEEAKKSLISEVVTGKVKVVKTDDGYELVKRKRDEMKDSGVEWLGEIPKDWEVKKLKYVSNIDTGNKDTQDKEENGIYPFFVRSDTVERSNTYSFNGEAILTAGDGVGVAKVFHYIKGKFAYHQRVYKISDFKEVKGKYIYYYIKDNLGKEVEKISVKTTVDSLRLPMFLNFPILINEEQEKIVDFLDEKSSQFDSIISKQEELIEKLKEAKQSLISEAVTGKIEILD